jgi:hypothetical protein
MAKCYQRCHQLADSGSACAAHLNVLLNNCCNAYSTLVVLRGLESCALRQLRAQIDAPCTKHSTSGR